jgi:pentatricopeptide repeat protein
LVADVLNPQYDGTRYAWKKRVETNFINPSDGICINVLNTAARHGDFVLATDVFRVLGNRSVRFEIHHYEALLEAYTEGGDIRSALTVLCVMADAGIEPSDASTRAIYKYLCEQPGSSKQAFEILHLLRKDGRSIPISAINCVLEASAFLGDITQALEYYKRLRDLQPDGPNITTFNVLLRGCTMSRRKDLAMFLVSEMQSLRIRPGALTYDRLILVCVQEDDYEDAFKYLEEMERQGWTPRLGTCKALVMKCAKTCDRRARELTTKLERKGINTVEMCKGLSELWGSERAERTEALEQEGNKESREPVVYHSA